MQDHRLSQSIFLLTITTQFPHDFVEYGINEKGPSITEAKNIKWDMITAEYISQYRSNTEIELSNTNLSLDRELMVSDESDCNTRIDCIGRYVRLLVLHD